MPRKRGGSAAPALGRALPSRLRLVAAVVEAARAGDVEELVGKAEALRALRVHLTECRDRAGWTPLAAASAAGEVDMVHFLLDAGCELEEPAGLRLAQFGGGSTPLQWAAARGHAAVCSALAAAGADVDDIDECSGRTALAAACAAEQHSVDCIVALLQLGADVNLPCEAPGSGCQDEYQDEYQERSARTQPPETVVIGGPFPRPAAGSAEARKHWRRVRVRVRAVAAFSAAAAPTAAAGGGAEDGAEQKQRALPDSDIESALSTALAAGGGGGGGGGVSSGARRNWAKLRLGSKRLTQQQARRLPQVAATTPLAIACQVDDVRCCKVLISLGAGINAPVPFGLHPVDGMPLQASPFYISCACGSLEVVRWLLSLEKDEEGSVEVDTTTPCMTCVGIGETPSQAARRGGHERVVALLATTEKTVEAADLGRRSFTALDLEDDGFISRGLEALVEGGEGEEEEAAADSPAAGAGAGGGSEESEEEEQGQEMEDEEKEQERSALVSQAEPAVPERPSRGGGGGHCGCFARPTADAEEEEDEQRP